MTARQRSKLRSLQGRKVHLALADGSRIDDVSLVSAGTRTVWVFANGEDAFIPVVEVVDAWESTSPRVAA